MNSTKRRIVIHDRFDGSSFTNENTLAAAQLTRPDVINPVVTHLLGKDEKRFPLTFLSEGQMGGRINIEVNDIQYEWPVFKKLRKTSAVVSHSYGASAKPGLNNQYFDVIFEDNWLKHQHNIVSSNGTVARIMTKPRPVGNGTFEYTLMLVSPDASSYCDLSQLIAGERWSMEGGANVSESMSFGNESNRVSPGKMKNQISILRKSYHMGGNIANKTVEMLLPDGKGKNTNKWVPFEEYLHRLEWMEAVEENLFWSEYNRRTDGSIVMVDPDNNLPIPYGAGIMDQIPNQDFYGKLTYTKIKNTISDVFLGATDTKQMVVTLFTGEGGAEEFHDAIMEQSLGWQLWQGNIADKMVTEDGSGGLKFGKYFRSYITPQGHIVVVKLINMFDYGSRADNAPKHPVSNRPITSYEMLFVDMSTYDGVKNVQMVSQKGRSLVRGILKGMAPLPDAFSWKGDAIATEQDAYSVHFLSAKGVVINRNTHCLRLSFDLDMV